MLATIAITLPALILFRRSPQSRIWRRIGIFAGFTLLMSTIISFPLWEILPKLKEVQLPWRWLAVTSAASSILVAASVPGWKEMAKTSKRPLALLAAGAVLMSLAFTVSHPIREALYLSETKFNQVVANVGGIPSIGPWYPKWVAERYFVMPEQVKAGERSVTVTAWGNEHRAFQVGPGPTSEASVHIFYYPLWSASAAGQPLNIRPDQDGTLLVALPENSVSVDLSFHEPSRSRISGVVSIVFVALIGLLAAWPPKRRG